jgi:hypothetical protein
MITFSEHGNLGRLGNQIMQYMAMIGISKAYNHALCMPPWPYAQYFTGPFPESSANHTPFEKKIKEPYYHFDNAHLNILFHKNHRFDLKGYYQSEYYWADHRADVKRIFTWAPEFKAQMFAKYRDLFEKKTIGIHFRRGDYVGHQSHHNLHINYYINALHKFDWEECNLLIFSDEPAYAKRHFECLPNAHIIANNNEIQDMCLMSLCDNFILSNSSYSWCAAWLGETAQSVIIHPNYQFRGEYAKSHDAKDFWPERWTCYDHAEYGEIEKIDLSDITFVIPVARDHKDRDQNLWLAVDHLREHFKTNIFIGEQGGNHYELEASRRVSLVYLNMPFDNFHRTRMINDMIKETRTPYVANWDADVLCAPMQLLEAVKKLRAGAEIVYPYDGDFQRVERNPWYDKLRATLDVGSFGDIKQYGLRSWGGAVLYNKKAFIEAGMENENFISFGPEDAERRERFFKLERNLVRQQGPLYHLEHHRGINSGKHHSYIQSNRAERNKVKAMSKSELLNYISTWNWSKV